MSQICAHCGKWTCQVCGGKAILTIPYSVPEPGVMGAFVKSQPLVNAFCQGCYETHKRPWTPAPVYVGGVA